MRTLAGKGRKAVVGFVVKKETWEEDRKTGVKVKVRIEVSRVYQSRDAAEVCLEMFKKHHPDGDYYISEKNRKDDVTLFG